MKNKTIAQQLKIKDFPILIKDKNNNRIYYENSDGVWVKSEFDENNNLVYYENSTGYIENKRPKLVLELTLEQIAEKFQTSVKNIKIKK
jgi:hypothetical protein